MQVGLVGRTWPWSGVTVQAALARRVKYVAYMARFQNKVRSLRPRRADDSDNSACVSEIANTELDPEIVAGGSPARSSAQERSQNCVYSQSIVIVFAIFFQVLCKFLGTQTFCWTGPPVACSLVADLQTLTLSLNPNPKTLSTYNRL